MLEIGSHWRKVLPGLCPQGGPRGLTLTAPLSSLSLELWRLMPSLGVTPAASATLSWLSRGDPSLQDDGRRGDFIKPTEQPDRWGPFTGDGVSTQSLCGARICSETRFPYTQVGRCWSSYPSPAPNFFTGYCYL